RKVGVPVVLICGHADVPMAVAGIKSGAEDFIEKPVDDAQLVAAINRAFARTFERQHLQKSQEALGRNFARLTPRQVEIFDLVAEGFTSHAIAAKLSISVRTVEGYRAEIMAKMQAASVAVLVRQALCVGRSHPQNSPRIVADIPPRRPFLPGVEAAVRPGRVGPKGRTLGGGWGGCGPP